VGAKEAGVVGTEEEGKEVEGKEGAGKEVEEMAMAVEGVCDGDDLGKCSQSRCQERT